jgi:hypothetical protein
MDANKMLSGQIRAHADVVWRDVDGEIVLLNVATGQYFGLDAVGSRVWLLLQQDGDAGATLAQLADRVVAEFDVDHATAVSDLTHLFQQLADQQLVTATA